MHRIGIREIGRPHEESLKPFFRSGNNSRIIPEEQSADYRHQYNRKEIGFTAFFLYNP